MGSSSQSPILYHQFYIRNVTTAMHAYNKDTGYEKL